MITDRSPTTRELLADLLGASPSRPEALRPTTSWLRPALVSNGVQSTYVIPTDWPTDPGRWYWHGLSYGKKETNNVEYLIDGKKAFAAMLEAIETATQPDHFIILLGWAAYFDFILVERDTPEAARTSLAGLTGLEILKRRLDLGVKVRVLLWDNSAPTEYDALGDQNNAAQKRSLDALVASTTGNPKPLLCILDNATESWGAHHQKILIVGGTSGIIGFFGGIDINPDRVQPLESRMYVGPAFVDVGAPLHDVHARVSGAAAQDLLMLAVNRWNFSRPVRAYLTKREAKLHDADPTLLIPGDNTPPRVKPGHDPALAPGQEEDQLPNQGSLIEDLWTLAIPALSKASATPPPHRVVQIAQTVGNPVLKRQLVNSAVSDAWPMIRHAIRSAKKFIYIEDQYLWSKDAARELAAALPQVRHLTLVVAPDDIVSASQRHEFVDLLFEEAESEESKRKIGIYNKKFPYHQYVHSKMFIMDDELAIIGSANCNNRGYYHDSEVIGVVSDPCWDRPFSAWRGNWYALEMTLAHRLRVELWAEHLDMSPSELWDGVASAVHWRRPPRSSDIQPYPYEPGSIEPGQRTKSYLFDDWIVDPK